MEMIRFLHFYHCKQVQTLELDTQIAQDHDLLHWAIVVKLNSPIQFKIFSFLRRVTSMTVDRNGSNVPEGTGGPSTPGSSSAAEESCDEWDDVTPTPVRRTKSSKEPQDFHNPSPPSVKVCAKVSSIQIYAMQF